jgi:hypothetical protein
MKTHLVIATLIASLMLLISPTARAQKDIFAEPSPTTTSPPPANTGKTNPVADCVQTCEKSTSKTYWECKAECEKENLSPPPSANPPLVCVDCNLIASPRDRLNCFAGCVNAPAQNCRALQRAVPKADWTPKLCETLWCEGTHQRVPLDDWTEARCSPEWGLWQIMIPFGIGGGLLSGLIFLLFAFPKRKKQTTTR